MARPAQRRTLLLFGVLTTYVVAQFIWWAVLLLRRDQEVHDLAVHVQALGGDPGPVIDTARSMRMVLGEGLVFVVLLLIVLLLTYRAVRRDLEMARAQRNFLLAVSHELRTPIAAIKLQLQTLSRPGLEEGQVQELKQRALDEAGRLAVLTDKVLLATRAAEDVIELHPEELDVMALLHAVAERARMGPARDHAVSVTGPAQCMVHADEEALRSIADNLVENAAKYAPPGTPIEISVEAARDGWRLLVADRGPGVPVQERDLIFERFHRGGQEETRRAKGTGLGLYIVRRLVQRSGGTVAVRERPGGGAIFAASFPLR
ncbi:MAG: HAMP domain-containing sensor histidine kinase [Flavobacteriales bacterium]|jgi:signal transduction histidine kinase|nr:HAMP domain-containing sensor histidine kinase [Flavobacteriales bacterium]